jgi:hypothetical protein
LGCACVAEQSDRLQAVVYKYRLLLLRCGTTGRVFSSTCTKPGLSFAAALRNNDEQQQQPHPLRASVAGSASVGKRSVPAPVRQKDAGQSVAATDVNSPPFDNMLRVVTIVQQIMTEFSGAVSEADNIVAITKIVLNLLKQNGH